MLRTAAVAGRAFDLLVVERASGADAGTVDAAVESALMLGLVEAEAVGRYRFTHALVRDALYAMVPPPTRARTHAAVAVALEDRYAGTVGAHVSELAEHYRLAGPGPVAVGVVVRQPGGRGRGGTVGLGRGATPPRARGDAAGDGPGRRHRSSGSRCCSAAWRPCVRLGHPLQAWPLVSAAATLGPRPR